MEGKNQSWNSREEWEVRIKLEILEDVQNGEVCWRRTKVEIVEEVSRRKQELNCIQRNKRIEEKNIFKFVQLPSCT